MWDPLRAPSTSLLRRHAYATNVLLQGPWKIIQIIIIVKNVHKRLTYESAIGITAQQLRMEPIGNYLVTKSSSHCEKAVSVLSR
jgi:hypothetical protein